MLTDIGILEYHSSLLADADRVDRYREAIFEVVRPGDVVVDVGTGTGLLAFFACQAGAARVFAIEEGRIINIARELALLNRFADRVEFFHNVSYRVELPARADVLITETLWNFGLGEGMVGFVEDARRRFLKPGARIIPEAVDLHVAPVQTARCYAHLHAWPPDCHGLDLSPIRHYRVNNVQLPHLHSDDFLAAPSLLRSTELDDRAARDVHASVTATITRSGVMHGICGWFRSRLSPNVALANEPPSTDSSWAHTLFPMQNPIGVLPGDEVSIEIQTASNSSIWHWRTEVRRAGTVVAAYDQTSVRGFATDGERRRRDRDAAAPAPQATLNGEVIGWVLQAMDGTRSLAQLEAEVLERFGSRYEHPEDAVGLVRSTAETLSE